MIETATLPALHPDHLTYLLARGVTPQTIAANGLHSARPKDLARLAGRSVPDGTSGLTIPYPDCDGFARVRLFPPIPTSDGTEQKFGQCAGSAVRLYVPAGVREILSDPERTISIIEGEVKALALTQAGYPTVALGGVWNFRTKELPEDGLIADLEALPWTGRIGYLIPDSDAWTNELVLQAVYRLARLLEARGATVLIVKLPTLDGQGKTGADDYLVAKGPAAFHRLVEKAVTLGHPAFKPWREKEKSKARQAEKATGPLPPELVGRRIHPALNLEDDFASIGIVKAASDGKGTISIITSDRREYPSEIFGQVATTKPLAYGPLVNRWPIGDREAWLHGKTKPTSFALAVGAVLALFNRLLDAPMPTLTILGCWTVATYFHRAFPAFARLYLTGERETGKSKAQQVIAALAFNGLYRVTPNGPPLFRLIDALRPTYCISEAEHLDGEQRQVLQAVLNEGYLRGGYVDRCDKESNWEPRPFEVFGPITLGNIKGMRGVMESRTIPLVMVRGTDRGKMNADVDPDGEAFRAARGLLYRLALERFQDVAEAWRSLPDLAWLVARERQLWRPLLVLASLADREAGGALALVDTLTEAAKRQTRDRAAPSDEAAALVTILEERLCGAEEIRLHPADLVDDLKSKLHRDHVTPTWAGHLLRRNGFEKPKPPEDRDSDGVFYRIPRVQLEGIKARYAIPPEQPTNLHTPGTYTPQPTEI